MDTNRTIKDAIRAAYDKGYSHGKLDGDTNSGCSRYVGGNVEIENGNELIVQLAASQPAQAPVKWHPIDSAPIHAEVIVWRSDSGAFLARKVAPCDVDDSESDSGEPAWLADQYGWQEGSETPTHWMPKPPAPDASQPAPTDMSTQSTDQPNVSTESPNVDTFAALIHRHLGLTPTQADEYAEALALCKAVQEQAQPAPCSYPLCQSEAEQQRLGREIIEEMLSGEPAQAQGEQLLAALKAAEAHIMASPHGDNCFLHDDGGEFDSCFCGKDSILSYLDGVLQGDEAQGDAFCDAHCTWRDHHPECERGERKPDWKAFALAVLKDSRENLGCDVDGALVQDAASEHGLLDDVLVQESCGEHCNCVEWGVFPTSCYRYSPEVVKAIAEGK